MVNGRARLQTELEVLKGNLAAGTCVGEPATPEQQDCRRRRIAQLEAQIVG